jgi:hypothetical protein
MTMIDRARLKELRHYAWITGLWVFLVWLGFMAIETSDNWLLTIYVLVAASAVAAVADKVHKMKSKP